VGVEGSLLPWKTCTGEPSAMKAEAGVLVSTWKVLRRRDDASRRHAEPQPAHVDGLDPRCGSPRGWPRNRSVRPGGSPSARGENGVRERNIRRCSLFVVQAHVEDEAGRRRLVSMR